MRRISLLILLSISTMLSAATVTSAQIEADYNSVRLMLTAPDNQDFSMFEQESLASILIEIIENDPEDARYHDRVVSSALVVLGGLHVPEAVDVLIGQLDNYTTTCVYWLGTYATADAVAAITGYLDSDDPSVRYEAAAALAGLPEIDLEDADLVEQLTDTAEVLRARVDIEEDSSVVEAVTEALDRIERDLESAVDR